MTAISFPYRAELEKLVRGTGHSVSFRETTYGNTRALNNSDKAGGALADKQVIKGKQATFEQLAPFSSELKLLMARIAPADWRAPRSYDVAELDNLVDAGRRSEGASSQ